MSVEQAAETDEQTAARQPSPRTSSLVQAIAAIAMLFSPLLLEPVPVARWILFLPVYFVVPVGISAVVCGLLALRRMRDQEEADPSRARAGVVLGSAVVVIPLTVVIFFIYALQQAYQ
ncbi:hypothetical protein [Streptomyces sp. NPDC046925]|uniref:hypothetical protein n=1 Tax=Streptomyces sp. NPDC046925 TaxID=3155375 RepID=UPI0033F10A59